jgi:phenylalanyl-tRNA synthetase beta chain
MRISLNLLKTCISSDLPSINISDLLTDIGLEVESVEHTGRSEDQLSGVLTGEVLAVAPHPDADRLRLTTVNIGTNTPLSIVCGAPNVAPGQKVAVATIGSRLPMKDGSVLEIRKSKIRGQYSEGMLCAEDELGLGDSHDGIMVLPVETPVGVPLSTAISISGDTLLEIGLTPNRTDAMSHYGVARDLAAAINTRGFGNTQAQLPAVDIRTRDVANPISIEITDTDACPRYVGVYLEGVKVAPSPPWLQSLLKSLDIGPINNVVDITNYVLHLCGQPLHAFDADKIEDKRVVVRLSLPDAAFVTLDGKERILHSEDLMICHGTGPMCIAGVFGGRDSGVSETTSRVFLESAYFAPGGIRRTSRRHGLQTDAAYRYERGADPDMCVYAARLAVKMLCELASASGASAITDVYPSPVVPYALNFNPSCVTTLGGVEIHEDIIANLLRYLGIQADTTTKPWSLLIPPFKHDVRAEADVVEEVLRIYGFDKIPIPAQLRIATDHRNEDVLEILQRRACNYLTARGFLEVHNLSFEASGEADAIKVLNPLAVETGFMRTSLRSGLLKNIGYNLARQEKHLKFFEFGSVYRQLSMGHEECEMLGLAVSGSHSTPHWRSKADETDVFHISGWVEGLISAVVPGNFLLKRIPVDNGLTFHLNGQKIGVLNLVTDEERKKYGLKQNTFLVELSASVLWECASGARVRFEELPRFPMVRRDLALVVPNSVTYATLEQLARESGGEFLRDVEIFDVFKGGELEADEKSYAMSFQFRSFQQTLSDRQVDEAVKHIYITLQQKAGARLRSGVL